MKMVKIEIILFLLMVFINKLVDPYHFQEPLAWDQSDIENQPDCRPCYCENYYIKCENKDTLQKIPSIATLGLKKFIFKEM